MGRLLWPRPALVPNRAVKATTRIQALGYFLVDKEQIPIQPLFGDSWVCLALELCGSTPLDKKREKDSKTLPEECKACGLSGGTGSLVAA